MSRHVLLPAMATLLVLGSGGLRAAEPTAKQIAFFEKKIRPVLVQKCYKCHSADAKEVKGGLYLDSREGIRQGGESGHAVVPGDVQESLLIGAIRHESFEMPPEEQLPDAVIDNFVRWIDMGAPDPRESTGARVGRKIDFDEARKFWAFQPPQESAPPAVDGSTWPLSELDRFVLARLQAAGLEPVEDANRYSLLRRVYFDLVGLPPSPQQIEAFLRDDSPRAFEKIVDQLLRSPQFGERWGRHWLDVARYAESNGRQRNYAFPYAWRYRDYVIASFNADKPYDRFIQEQIAGDLLPAAGDQQRIATGFLAIGPKALNERDREKFTMDLVDEQIDVSTRAVMALTVACARCHDHKFDPIPTSEYYAIAGIFRSTKTLFGTGGKKGNRQATSLMDLGGDSPQQQAVRKSHQQKITKLTKQLQRQQKILLGLQRQGAATSKAKLKTVANASANQTALGRRQAANAARQKRIAAAQAAVAKLDDELQQLRTSSPPPPSFAMGVAEGDAEDCRLYIRGDTDTPGSRVPRGFLTVLGNADAAQPPTSQSGRLELADWLTDPQNPLTARVEVNRIWQHLFGRGLVGTADNFGANGDKPTHPQLLDYLALKFIRDGWSVKSMIRWIVLSRTYGLGSRYDQENYQVDPDNYLHWRHATRRLDAESLRDTILSASGRLDLTAPIGSPVAQAGDGEVGRGDLSAAGMDVDDGRRSVYLPILRNAVPESLRTFDFAEPSMLVSRRDVTTVPTQALYMMNSPFVVEQSSATAERLLADSEADDAYRLDRLYLLTLSRPPRQAERERALRFVDNLYTQLEPHEGDLQRRRLAAWASLCQALFASAEFRYQD